MYNASKFTYNNLQISSRSYKVTNSLPLIRYVKTYHIYGQEHYKNKGNKSNFENSLSLSIICAF